MADYKRMYYKMFNAMTLAQSMIREAEVILQEAQQECEELFIRADDTPISLTESDRQQK